MRTIEDVLGEDRGQCGASGDMGCGALGDLESFDHVEDGLRYLLIMLMDDTETV